MKKAQRPRMGFYEESEFTPLVETLRELSQDNTPLEDNYVGFYRNVTDMISPDGAVNGIKFDTNQNALVITYMDGKTETIVLPDNYLKSVSYVYNAVTKSHTAIFTLMNGEVITDTENLNKFRNALLDEFKDVFYTKDEVYDKEEVDDIVDNIDSLQWIPLE